MKARILYEITHISYGDQDERTGWYLQRITLALKPDGKPETIVDKVPIAKFEDHPVNAGAEVLTINRAVEAGTFCLMPQDWTFDDLARDVPF